MCEDEAERLCGQKDSTCGCKEFTGPGGKEKKESPGGKVLACLTKNRATIKNFVCKMAVENIVNQQVDDYELGMEMRTACTGDAWEYCDGITAGHGKVHECLLDHLDKVTPECQKAEFESQVSFSNEVTLGGTLRSACATLLTKGGPCENDATYKCLVRNKLSKETRNDCKEELTRREIWRNRDYRLNPSIRQSCKKYIIDFCQEQAENKKDLDGKVLACLISNRHELSDKDCQDAVMAKVTERAEDWRVNPETSTPCEHDFKTHCKEVQPGMSRVHNCLMQHYEDLEKGCQEAEFKMFAQKADKPQNSPALHKACKVVLDSLCANFPEAAKFDCLFEKRDSRKVTPECKKEIDFHAGLRGRTVSFSPMIGWACKKSLEVLVDEKKPGCADVKLKPSERFPGKEKKGGFAAKLGLFSGGQMMKAERLTCLLDNLQDIPEEKCAEAAKSTARFILDDPITNRGELRMACAEDIAECKKDGKTTSRSAYKCLVSKKDKVSKPCATHVTAIQKMRGYDIRLNPGVSKNCALEQKLFCADIPPGKSRLLACLASHKEDDEFSTECKQSLAQAALVLPDKTLQRYKKAAELKGKHGEGKLSTTRVSDPEDENEAGPLSSFEISGPIAIAALAALFFVCGAGVAVCIKRRRSKGYTVYVADE